MRSLISLLFLLISTHVAANSIAIRQSMPMDKCAAHTPYGIPKSARSDTTQICRHGYALEHDNKAKIPAWVAYTLTSDKAVGCKPRVSTFRMDPSIDADSSARMKDYSKSGYDIGHMANSGDMRWSARAEAESNVFSNAAPQLAGLNRAAWKMLEDQTRAWAIQRQNDLLIYVGPIYEKRAPSTIGVGKVTIPLSFYKIIVDSKTNEVIVFLYPHQESGAPPSSFQTSLHVVQSLTQIVFPIPQRSILSVSIWPADTKSARYEKTKTCILAQKP